MLNFLGLSAIAVTFIFILIKLGALSAWVIILKTMLVVAVAVAMMLAVALIWRLRVKSKICCKFSSIQSMTSGF